MKRLALGAAVAGILVSVVALAACRREEPCCQPLKLGGPIAQQPTQ